ncbi:hypothetical protein BJY01DRAFT_227836 [Aspergillus pseudoustus]|uniref:Uncharacterized protein n=1 Tax=Aspergillus pseudoustus TaxID=1810923 RepID=A0ABR4IP76_9EURO
MNLRDLSVQLMLPRVCACDVAFVLVIHLYPPGVWLLSRQMQMKPGTAPTQNVDMYISKAPKSANLRYSVTKPLPLPNKSLLPPWSSSHQVPPRPHDILLARELKVPKLQPSPPTALC